VFAWLTVEQKTLSRVKSHPDGAARSVHARVDEAADFDTGPERWPNQLVEDSGVLPPPSVLEPELAPALDGRADRVLSVRTQTFSSVVYRIAYATALSSGIVDVAGRPPAIAASSDWRPLSRRRLLVIAAGASCAFVALRVRDGYMGRHPWFAQYGHGGAVLWVALLASVLVTVASAGLTLAPRARSRNRTTIPAALAGGALLAALLSYVVGGPTRAGAERALVDGDLARAHVEAAALIELATDRAGGEELEDTMHLKAVQQSDDFVALVAEVAKPWHADAQREAAFQRLHALGDGTAALLYAQHSAGPLEALAGLLDEPDPALAQRLHGLALVLRAREHVAQGEFATAKDLLDKAAGLAAPPEEVGRTRDALLDAMGCRFQELVQTGSAASGDPHPRRDALVAALALSSQFTAISGKPTDPAAEELQKRLEPLKKEVDAADKRAAELAAQAEAKRKREEAVAEAKRKQEEAVAEARRRAEEAADDGSDPGDSYGGRASHGGGSVQVRGYTRKDGTYVHPHTRRR
jgi:hypothetical protein